MQRPDLLHVEARPRRDVRALRQTLVFAFASSGGEDSLIEASQIVEPTESDWDAECFEEDLFIERLVAAHSRIVIGDIGFDLDRVRLRQILTHPPRDIADTHFRQGILREFERRPLLWGELEHAYVALRSVRSTLAGPPGIRARGTSAARRVDVLVAIRGAIDALAVAFENSETGLRRLGDWGRNVQSSPAYERLRQLLDFENHRATLETQLQVGYDGTLRRFEIVRVSEVEHESFSSSWLGRLWRGCVSLLKGYRFSEADVLSRLLDEVYGDLEEVLFTMLPLIAEIEFYLAARGFRRIAEKRDLAVSLPELAQDGSGPRAIVDLFNPWLLHTGGGSPVPCELELDRARSTLILTGPNSGGKTRMLQAVAITQLLGQCGFYVPARSAVLQWTDGMFLSLREHTAADQEEGRLGMELLRIRKVFERSCVGALVILDELCTGTNPSEGEEIFELVLTLLEELEPQVFISTHFLDFARGLSEAERAYPLHFLRVELDERDVPTYQFVPGVAKTSLAKRTAARLGVTREELQELVERKKLTPSLRPSSSETGGPTKVAPEVNRPSEDRARQLSNDRRG